MMISSLFLIMNVFSPIISQIDLGNGHLINAKYQPKLDMMSITVEDFTDLKSLVESTDASCYTEKKSLEREYKMQLEQHQTKCDTRIKTLQNALNNAETMNKMLTTQNGLLTEKNTLLKWVSIGVGAVSVGVSGYLIVR